MRRLMFVPLLLAALLMPAIAHAQTVVVNPTTVIFPASGDHDAVRPLDGSAVLSKYMLRFFLEGASSPVQEQDLGKPTPTAGVITIVNRALFTGTPLALDTKYVARVAAVGPGGEGVSAASGPFGNASPLTAPRAPASAPTLRQ
jgi:hypothetical protein